jgi:hypothetical protein
VPSSRDSGLTYDDLAVAFRTVAKVSKQAARDIGAFEQSMWGMRTVVSDMVPRTKTIELELRRTWRERLFSWPWRPWAATRLVTKVVPNDEVFLVNMDALGFQATGSGGTTLFCNSAQLAAVRMVVAP